MYCLLIKEDAKGQPTPDYMVVMRGSKGLEGWRLFEYQKPNDTSRKVYDRAVTRLNGKLTWTSEAGH